ncbi:MAG: hypothetical protein IKD10_13400 [Lentisphaeria bacterium]|nr:hypothetical protein [Lentisphaeria bacterium]
MGWDGEPNAVNSGGKIFSPKPSQNFSNPPTLSHSHSQTIPPAYAVSAAEITCYLPLITVICRYAVHEHYCQLAAPACPSEPCVGGNSSKSDPNAANWRLTLLVFAFD